MSATIVASISGDLRPATPGHTPGHSSTADEACMHGIARSASCATSDWLTSTPGGCSQPRGVVVH